MLNFIVSSPSFSKLVALYISGTGKSLSLLAFGPPVRTTDNFSDEISPVLLINFLFQCIIIAKVEDSNWA